MRIWPGWLIRPIPMVPWGWMSWSHAVVVSISCGLRNCPSSSVWRSTWTKLESGSFSSGPGSTSSLYCTLALPKSDDPPRGKVAWASLPGRRATIYFCSCSRAIGSFRLFSRLARRNRSDFGWFEQWSRSCLLFAFPCIINTILYYLSSCAWVFLINWAWLSPFIVPCILSIT